MTINPCAAWLYAAVATFGPGIALVATLTAIGCAASSIRRHARTRRDIRRLEAHLRNPAVIARYSRKEKP